MPRLTNGRLTGWPDGHFLPSQMRSLGITLSTSPSMPRVEEIVKPVVAVQLAMSTLIPFPRDCVGIAVRRPVICSIPEPAEMTPHALKRFILVHCICDRSSLRRCTVAFFREDSVRRGNISPLRLSPQSKGLCPSDHVFHIRLLRKRRPARVWEHFLLAVDDICVHSFPARFGYLLAGCRRSLHVQPTLVQCEMGRERSAVA